MINLVSIARLGTSYVNSYFAYNGDGLPKPFSASFSVTNRCNIHCTYCNYPGINRPELSLEEIEIVFKRLKKAGVIRLGLLGGEPLFRKDIIDIIRLAKSVGFSVSMNTNLLIYNKYKDKLDGVDFFYTSIDGNEEKHTKNRGKQNYQGVLDAVKDLRSRGKKVIPICVITEPDYENAEFMFELGKDLDVDIHFQPECYGAEYSRTREDAEINNRALREFWGWMAEMKKQKMPISSSLDYLLTISRWDDFTNPVKYIKGKKCAAGRGFIYVDVSGMAYTCPYITGDASFVNLLENEWQTNCDLNTPCNSCIVGPMLEFNLLYEKPIVSIINALKNI
jgi:MoaA/NifB/PqqE/SkfB family radical SAM enzyme